MRYYRLATSLYKYAKQIKPKNEVESLAILLYRQTNLPATLNKSVFELVLQFAMPGKFTPLNATMRGKLASHFAKASEQGVLSEDLEAFILAASKAQTPGRISKMRTADHATKEASAPVNTLKGRLKRRPKDASKRHPVANSSTHKAFKADMKLAKRRGARRLDERLQ